MRDPRRIKLILEELEKYWTANPDLRLCQIIGNMLYTTRPCGYCNGAGFSISFGDKLTCLRCLGNGYVDISTYNVEDDIILEKLEKLNRGDGKWIPPI